MICKVYEVYCQKHEGEAYEDDNFSLFIACNKRPNKKKLTEILKDKLDGYCICWITDDITFDLDGLEIMGVDYE